MPLTGTIPMPKNHAGDKPTRNTRNRRKEPGNGSDNDLHLPAKGLSLLYCQYGG